MIEIYKIGIKNYYVDDKVVDKNSGLFELKIIEEEVKDILTDKQVLIIVNGKFTNCEERIQLLQYMTNYDMCVFIASDIIAFDDNADIIKRCDVLLHQAPQHQFKQFKIQQCYSYLPEAFYKYTAQTNTTKYKQLIFGGGVRDNEKKILSYLNAVWSSKYIKSTTMDNRLQYSFYLKELAKHRYSLVISRKRYAKVGWITSRYFESIANGVIPICDKSYDKSNHLSSIVKVRNAKQLKKLVNDTNYTWRRQFLEEQYSMCEHCQDSFKITIASICEGEINGN